MSDKKFETILALTIIFAALLGFFISGLMLEKCFLSYTEWAKFLAVFGIPMIAVGYRLLTGRISGSLVRII